MTYWVAAARESGLPFLCEMTVQHELYIIAMKGILRWIWDLIKIMAVGIVLGFIAVGFGYCRDRIPRYIRLYKYEPPKYLDGSGIRRQLDPNDPLRDDGISEALEKRSSLPAHQRW